MKSMQHSLSLMPAIENDLNNFVSLLQSQKRILDPLSHSVFDLLDAIDSFKKNAVKYNEVFNETTI